MKAKAYATYSDEGELVPFDCERREVGASDVAIDILYCGICHSDLHLMRNEWKNSTYPMVPGHEIIGRVAAVGNQVIQFKQGDLVGVGCMVDSCRRCHQCEAGEEQFCEQGMTLTYNSEDNVSGGMTYGGYSNHVVVTQEFVLKVAPHLSAANSAPLLCAGITTYSPLKRAKVGPGSKVGIIGLGGLGHMGVKIAKAMGAQVLVITHSANKVVEAKALGADEVVLSSDQQQMNAQANSFDFLLDTVSAKHDINRYFELLRVDGVLTQVGLPGEPMEVSVFPLIFKRISFTGSLIGGIRETQEMLDFCAKHAITADIELIAIQDINQAMQRLERGDVKYRFVIDMATI